MASRFLPLTVEEFAELLARFCFERKIDAVHMHHTWRPDHSQYRGEDSIEAMWRFHTRVQGWSDIAQHVTVAPDGTIWTGRDWNRPPASAVGFNGNGAAGPFMFETIGDFDAGCDPLAGPQRRAVVEVIARVQQRFALAPESLRFHRAMTDQKTCPGTGVDYDQVLAEVRAARERLEHEAKAPRGLGVWAGAEHAVAAGRVEAVLRRSARNGSRAPDPHDAEPPESQMTRDEVLLVTGVAGSTRPAPGSAARGGARGDLTPEMLAALRPHVVNLNQGRFSAEGLFRTSAADVDAIFGDHLARAFRKAQGEQRPLRLLFWAHGGLIAEQDGLWIAHQQASWWEQNRIYPIFFVWETGFLDALRQILTGARGARDIWDHTTDPAVEALTRSLGGDKIWSAMKRSAELAVAADGGARYVAGKLRDFCRAHAQGVELHAVGHSAGSIFHSHFLPVAFDLGVPAFRTLQLLAPAIRVDRFKDLLLRRVGPHIQALTMYTMQRDWERADNVMSVYRKSLLYLIYHALEPEARTPILGLEECVRGDADLTRLFALDGGRPDHAQVVWAETHETTGRNVSTSHSHGGFDNDRPTMNSVTRRVLDADAIVDFPEEAVERSLAAWAPVTDGARPPVASTVVLTTPTPPVVSQPPPGGGGARRALCVGINGYPGTLALEGCVADAEQWARILEQLGFRCALLTDQQATREAILEHLRTLVTTSTTGDVVVFQYAGHGTQVDDVDGDEADGKDESLCPVDIMAGAYLIDDDVAEVFAAIPDGVNVTCFIDCCHSGTMTRFMIGPPAAGTRGGRSKARFITPTREMQASHRCYRERLGGRRGGPVRDESSMRQVVFSACQDHEVAYETDGHGEFTVRATALLGRGAAGLAHDEFERRVVAAFGQTPRQHPRLDCADPARGRVILAPLVGGAGGRALPAMGFGGNGGSADLIVAEALRAAAAAIAARR